VFKLVDEFVVGKMSCLFFAVKRVSWKKRSVSAKNKIRKIAKILKLKLDFLDGEQSTIDIQML